MILIGVIALIILSVILYLVIMAKPKNYIISTPVTSKQNDESTYNRDLRVVKDPLYPPLNREESRTFNNMTREVENRNMYVATNGSDDSYRLVGYLTNNDSNRDAGGNNWKLFARMKNRNEAEFYIIPSNNNYDIKIPLSNDMVVGDRLRDIYTIPGEMRYNSPMLNKTPYTFTELKSTDYNGGGYY
jgi:hypothetical protein